MIRVLFICHGNICRSTMAESVMTYLVKQWAWSWARTMKRRSTVSMAVSSSMSTCTMSASGCGQLRGNARQHAFAVAHRNLDACLKCPCWLFTPVNCDEAFTILVLQSFCHIAFRAVYHQAFSTSEVSNNGVAWHGAAAGCAFDRGVLAPIQRHCALRGSHERV